MDKIYRMPFPYWEQMSNRVADYPIQEENSPPTDIVEVYIEQEYGLRFTGRVNIPDRKEWDMWEETYDYIIVDSNKFHKEFAWFVLNFKED